MKKELKLTATVLGLMLTLAIPGRIGTMLSENGKAKQQKAEIQKLKDELTGYEKQEKQAKNKRSELDKKTVNSENYSKNEQLKKELEELKGKKGE